jgi:hypothetical protein
VASALGVSSLPALAKQLTFPWRQADAPLEIDLNLKKGTFEYRWTFPPGKLPKPMERLFWDTPPHSLNLEHHAVYIIARVLERGDLEDWNWLRWTYGEVRIAAVIRQKTKLARETIHLWRSILIT